MVKASLHGATENVRMGEQLFLALGSAAISKQRGSPNSGAAGSSWNPALTSGTEGTGIRAAS